MGRRIEEVVNDLFQTITLRSITILKLKPLSFVACLLLLFSCKCYNYVGSPKYVPLNSEKGKTTINLYASNIQVGHSFTQHFGGYISAHGRTARESKYLLKKEHSGDTVRNSGDRQIDFGCIYSISKGRFILEMIVGGGLGRSRYSSTIELYPDGYDFQYSARTRNVFIQPNIGMKYKGFSLALFTKLTHWQFYDINAKLQNPGNWYYVEDQYFLDNKMLTSDFAEPGIQLRTGTKNFEFIAQLSGTINLTGQEILVRKANLNLGCVFIIGSKTQ